MVNNELTFSKLNFKFPYQRLVGCYTTVSVTPKVLIHFLSLLIDRLDEME